MVGQAPRAAEEGLQAEAGSADLRLHQRGPALTLYLDSSAFAKLFLDEPGGRAVARAVEEAGVRATSRLSFVECGAAFARAEREGRAPRGQVSRMIAVFEAAWQDVVAVELDDQIAGRAVVIARDHALRASEAIHLASALAVAPASGDVTFACFDPRLGEAAGTLGMGRLPASAP